MPEPLPTHRAADTDRERTAEVLRDAAGDGRITLDELETRLEQAYAARTYADLARVTADLPAAMLQPALPVEDKPLLLVGEGGSVRRTGRWYVPSRVVVDRKFGSVLLDFREVVFAAAVTQVELRMRYGSAVLVLPERATAALDVASRYGSVRSSVPGVPVPGQPHLVVTGEKEFGSLRVRYGYRRWWRRHG